MEIYISSDFGKSWVFVGLLDQFPKDFVEQVLFKAGYATRVLYPLDVDFHSFRSKEIFPVEASVLPDASKPTYNA